MRERGSGTEPNTLKEHAGMQTAGFNTGGFRTYSRTSPNTSAQISPELEGEREKRGNTPPQAFQTHERETERQREMERDMSLATVTNILALGGGEVDSASTMLQCIYCFIQVRNKQQMNGTVLQSIEYTGAFYAVPSKPLADYVSLDWHIIVFIYHPLARVTMRWLLPERKLKQAL